MRETLKRAARSYRITRRISAADLEHPLSWAFVGFVALSLLVPLVQTLYPLFGTIVAPLDERREPNPFPPLRLLLRANGDFATGLNKWFDDHVGFRDVFIRSKNQIDYTLFDISRKVYIGSNGWLFDRPVSHDVERLDAGGLTALEQSYVTLALRLHDKGIRLIVVGYPDKAAIYPEMAPSDMPLIRVGGNYEHFRQFLAARSDLTFIDAEKILRREKSRIPQQLYYKTDIHATPFADIPIVKAIVATIAQVEGTPNIRWDEKFKLAPNLWPPGQGSEARFMSLLFPVKEGGFDLTGTYAVGRQELDGHWLVPDPVVFERADSGIGRPFDFEFRSLPELCPQRLPGMVLFGNSFSDLYWALGLHRYFCFIRRARDPISRFKAFYDTIPPGTKYFIFQYWEPWVTEVLSDRWFSAGIASK